MGSEEKKFRKRKKKNFRIVLILVVVIYLIFRTIPGLYASSQKTYTVEAGTAEVSVKTEGIIVKDEKVYRSEAQGELSIFKDEGEKLGIGDKIMQISIGGRKPMLEEELADIEQSIKELSEKTIVEELFHDDLEKSQSNIDFIIEQIRVNSIEGNYEEIDRLRDELSFNISKQKHISGEDRFIGNNIEDLKNRRNDIIAQIEGSNKIYFADKTGIITYKIDGLEEVYSINRIHEYSPDDFKIIEEQPINLTEAKSVRLGDVIFKVVDNYSWYVIVKLDTKDLDLLEEGKDVNIKFSKDDSSIKARIYSINSKDKQALVVFKFNDYLYRFIDERYVDIEIIKRKYEGLKVPHSAVVNKDGVEGVFIQDISNIVKFRAINILGEDDEFLIVDEGQKNNIGERGKIEVKIDDKTEIRYTITMFDKVLVNGTRVKEGDIIN